MKYKCALLCVRDMEKSVDFYRRVMGLRVVMDFGANKTLTGGLSLQTIDTWADFIEKDPSEIKYGNAYEIYFEEDKIDAFVKRITEYGVETVHALKTHPWGQRVVRLYDPDGHILEIGKTLNAVAKRFSAEGMDERQIAERMGIPLSYAVKLLK